MAHHAQKIVVVPILSLLAMVMLAVFPWAWKWYAAAGVACLAAVFAWAVWLMVLYLRWARGLTHDDHQQDQ
jgi:hypothetical protein